MTASIGHNTPSGEKLRSFVERLERLVDETKALGQDKTTVMAEAKSAGFAPGVIRQVLKIRAMKPHERQENESLLDLYLHALGMAEEPPLFRAMNAASVDTSSRDSVIGALEKFVPQQGDMIVRMGKDHKRLWRDKAGVVHVDTYIEPVATAAPSAPARATLARPPVDVPDVDEDGAAELGAQYANDNKPVIANPFPFGDARRARFDEGWREAAGGDGMGPADDV